MVNVGLTENMKKFILNNMIVAATFLVGMLMLDFIHVHSGYRLKDPAYFVVPLALLLASFCYANRGLLDDKSPMSATVRTCIQAGGLKMYRVLHLLGTEAGLAEATRGGCVVSPDEPQTRALSLRDEDCIEGKAASGQKSEG